MERLDSSGLLIFVCRIMGIGAAVGCQFSPTIHVFSCQVLSMSTTTSLELEYEYFRFCVCIRANPRFIAKFETPPKVSKDENNKSASKSSGILKAPVIVLRYE
jgi:hypothetical protein